MNCKRFSAALLFAIFFASGSCFAGDFELSINVDSVKCYGDSSGKIHIKVDYNETNNFTYALFDKPPWKGGIIFFNSGIINSNSYTFNNLFSGNYFLFVEADNGKVSIKNIPIYEPSPLLIEGIIEYNQSVSTDEYTYLKAIAKGGSPPYSYTWYSNSGTLNSQTIEIKDEGVYEVTVSDSNGCGLVSMKYYHYSNFIKKITHKILKN